MTADSGFSDVCRYQFLRPRQTSTCRGTCPRSIDFTASAAPFSGEAFDDLNQSINLPMAADKHARHSLRRYLQSRRVGSNELSDDWPSSLRRLLFFTTARYYICREGTCIANVRICSDDLSFAARIWPTGHVFATASQSPPKRHYVTCPLRQEQIRC